MLYINILCSMIYAAKYDIASSSSSSANCRGSTTASTGMFLYKQTRRGWRTTPDPWSKLLLGDFDFYRVTRLLIK